MGLGPRVFTRIVLPTSASSGPPAHVDLLLADRLTCSRCGPDFGLILLAHEVAERRVIQGLLGCPNCREKYPVSGGFGDLRPPPRSLTEDSMPGPAGDPDSALRLAALMGVSEGHGHVLIAGPLAPLAPELRDLVPTIEFVAQDMSMRSVPEAVGVTRIAAGKMLPFVSSCMRAVALGGEEGISLIADGARVLIRGGRLVLNCEDETSAAEMEKTGLSVLLQEDGWWVAALP